MNTTKEQNQIFVMPFFVKYLNVFLVLSLINMSLATENRSLLYTESNAELVVLVSAISPVNISETVMEHETRDSEIKEHMNVTENVIDFNDKENLNDTSAEFENSTNETETDIDDIHSSFNLAIIPTVAIFVFLVVTCFKCCKWFRQYTRGGDKDDNENLYAVIVTEDDKEYGQIDMLSESASTTYYDTASSYTSFLKRSESTVESIKAWRKESNKNEGCSSQPSRIESIKVNSEPYVNKITSSSYSNKKSDDSSGKLDEISPSTSNVELFGAKLPDHKSVGADKSLRVSFVTETKSVAPKNGIPCCDIDNEKIIRPSLKKTPSAASPAAHQIKLLNEIKMVDAGTQTNKSFRYSIRKSKGHLSDSDVDQRYFCKLSTVTSELQSDDIQSKDKDTLTDKRPTGSESKCTQHSSMSFDESKKKHLSSVCPEISKYPFDTNVEIIHSGQQKKEPSNEDLDFDDEVFVEEIPTDRACHSEINKYKDVSVSEDHVSNDKDTSNEYLAGLNKSKEICSERENPVCTNFDKPFFPDGLLDSGTNPVIQNTNEKCTFAQNHTQTFSCAPESDKTQEFLLKDMQNQGKVAEINNITSSSLSLESSGYAELYSSDDSTCSP